MFIIAPIFFQRKTICKTATFQNQNISGLEEYTLLRITVFK